MNAVKGVRDIVAVFKLDTTEFDKGVKKAKQSTDDLGKGTDKTNASATKLGGNFKSLVTVMGTVTAGVGAAIAVFNQLSKAAQEGANLDRLQQSGEALAKTFGSSMESVVNSVKSASMGTISEMDIIASSNKAMLLGLGADAQTMGDLMEVAAYRAKAMGMTTTAAYDDIIRGIGRMSPLILDNLGITFDAEKVYTEYALAIGKTKDQLSEAEKKQALLNATIKEGNKMMDETGGLLRDNATAYEQFAAMRKNASDVFKMGLAEWFTPVVEGANRTFFMDQLVELFIQGMERANTKEFETYGEYIGEAISRGIETGLLKEKWGDTLTEALLSQDEIQAYIDKFMTDASEYTYYGGNRVKVRYQGEFSADWIKLTEDEQGIASLIEDLNTISYRMGGTGIKSVEDFTSALNILGIEGFEAAQSLEKLNAATLTNDWRTQPYTTGYKPYQTPADTDLFAHVDAINLATLERYNKEMQTLQAQMSGTLGDDALKFAEAQNEIKAEMEAVNQEIEKYLGWGYSEQGSKIQELRADYDELGKSYDKNASDHEESTRRIIFDMLQVQAAEQGFTDSSFFYDLAYNWGLIDEATRDAMNASAEFISLLSTDLPIPIALLDELGIKLEDLPDEVRSRVIVETEFTYSGYRGELYSETGGMWNSDPYDPEYYPDGHAVGGTAYAGELIGINEYGTEGFIPAVNGRIVPVSEMNRMTGAQTDSTQDALLREIRGLPLTMKMALKEAMATIEG